MLARLPRPGRRFVVTTATLLALATVAAVAASVVVAGTGPAGGAGPVELRRLSVLTGAAAATSFGLATLLVVRTRRLAPGLWGYVPGLVLSVACGLAAGSV